MNSIPVLGFTSYELIALSLIYFPATPVILVTHIPKCVGTSLRYALVEELGILKENLYRPGSTGENKFGDRGMSAIFFNHPSNFDYLIGHYPWGVHYLFRPWSKVARRPKLFVATLREPIDQMISFYYYHCQLQAGNGLSARYEIKDMVDFYRKATLASNQQVRGYCGLPFSFARVWKQSRHILGDDWLVKKALNRLISNYPFWIHHSLINESVSNLGAALGVKLNLPKAKLTVTRDRPRITDLSDETIQELRFINSMDVKLHEALKPYLNKYCGLRN